MNLKNNIVGLFVISTLVSIFSCAKNNKIDILVDAGGCDTSIEMSYNNNIRPIFKQNCNASGCHNQASSAAGYNLSDYNSTRDAVLSSRFFGSINHEAGFSPMPKNTAKLSECDIRSIYRWVDEGAQNN